MVVGFMVFRSGNLADRKVQCISIKMVNFFLARTGYNLTRRARPSSGVAITSSGVAGKTQCFEEKHGHLR